MCHMLWCGAVCFIVLHCIEAIPSMSHVTHVGITSHKNALHTMQHNNTHCTTLQHTATYYKTM